MDLTGTTLGKYELVERLGQGGMAAVYKAFQPGVERYVAIKVMLGHLAESDDFVARFQREARAVGQLQHTHIVRIIDFDIEGDMYYMVMEYIEGQDLQTYLKSQGGVLPYAKALQITDELASALAYAHERGMIHRDIKPANIMSASTEFNNAVLMDFGIAHLIDDSKLTMTGAMVGTPAYMSPEAMQGKTVDARSDIYSLGIVLYELVTGRPPYVADTPFALISKLINEPMPEPKDFQPDVPEQLNRLLLKALAKNPDERYQTAKEFQTAIKHNRMALGDASAAEVINITSAHAVPASSNTPNTVIASTSSTPTNSSRINQDWLPLVGAVVAILLIAGITAFALLNFGRETTTTTPTVVAVATGTVRSTETKAVTATPMPATDTPLPVVVPTEEATATLEAAVILDPTATLEPTATVEPTIELIEIPAGFVEFRDSDEANAGNLIAYLERVPLLPEGTEYVMRVLPEPENETGAWTLGTFDVLENDTISFDFSANQNFFTNYAAFEVRLVGNGRDEAVYTGVQSLQLTLNLRAILYDGADDRGFIQAATQQGEIALQHTRLLKESLAAGDLNEVRRHAEHVLNILDGEGGDNFGDRDGDGQAQNPGNGIGVRVYLNDMLAIGQEAMGISNEQALGIRFLTSIDNALTLQSLAQETVLQVFSADSAEEIQPIADDIEQLVENMLFGVDRNEDGVEDIRREEGALVAAYQQALDWGVVKLYSNGAVTFSAEPTVFAPNSVGVFRVQEGAAGESAFLLDVSGFALLPEDQKYVVWLEDNAGIVTEQLGEITSREIEESSGFFMGDIGQSIIENFRGVIISIETSDSEDLSLPSQIIYRGQWENETHQKLQFVLIETAPNEESSLSQAETQKNTMLDHAGFMQDALTANDFAGVRIHAEHVINMLVGSDSDLFTDWNRDGQTQNPGSDFGLLPLLDVTYDALDEIINQDNHTHQSLFYIERARVTISENHAHFEQALDLTEKIFAMDSLDEVEAVIDDIRFALEAGALGTDFNEDGIRDPLLFEGGLVDVYDLVLMGSEIPIIQINTP